MTREEALNILHNSSVYHPMYLDALNMAIEALEQDTVPFDFDLYQAGLMDIPKEMIEVLNKIRDEIEEIYTNITYQENKDREATWELRKALEIIDKYKSNGGV